jgi:hypothetical protein
MGLSAQSWSIRTKFNLRVSDLPFSLPRTLFLDLVLQLDFRVADHCKGTVGTRYISTNGIQFATCII